MHSRPYTTGGLIDAGTKRGRAGPGQGGLGLGDTFGIGGGSYSGMDNTFGAAGFDRASSSRMGSRGGAGAGGG